MPTPDIVTTTYLNTSSDAVATGDLVYNSRNTIGVIPASSITGNVTFNTTQADSYPISTSDNGPQAPLPWIYGGSIGKNAVNCSYGGTDAILIAYIDNQVGAPYFVIISAAQPTSQPLYGPQVLSATFLNTTASNIAAVRLVGTANQVAIAWTNTAGGTANRINYAIVNAGTGVISVAATQDTAAAINTVHTVPIRVTSNSSGNFFIGFAAATPAVYTRGYNGTTGVALYAWNNVANLSVGSSLTFGMSSPDTRLLVAGPSTTANNVGVIEYDASTGAVTNALFTFASQIGTTTMGGVDVNYLNISGTNQYVIAYNATGSGSIRYPSFRVCTETTMDLTEEYYVPAASVNMINSGTTGSITTWINVYNFTGVSALGGVFYVGDNTGDILISFAGSTSNGAGYVVMNIVDVLNNQTAQSVTVNPCRSLTSTIFTSPAPTPVNTLAVAHISGTVYAPSSNGCFVATNTTYNGSLGTYWYQTVTAATTTLARGTTVAMIYQNGQYVQFPSLLASYFGTVWGAVGTPITYSQTASTPTAASFLLSTGVGAYYAPTTGTLTSQSLNTSTYLHNLFGGVIDATPASGVSLTTDDVGTVIVGLARGNGKMVIKTYLGTPSSNETWTGITDLNFFQTPSSYLNSPIKISYIPSTSNIVIAYATSATNVRVILMDYTTGSIAATVQNITVTSMAMTSNSTTFDVAGISLSTAGVPRYVIAYNASTGSRLAFQVFNGTTNANIITEQLVSAAATTTAAVGAFSTGGFLLACRDTTTTFSQIYTYGNPTANTFTQVLGATNLSGAAATVDNRLVGSTSNGYVITQDLSAATTATVYLFSLGGTIANFSYALGTTTANGRFCGGFTAMNAPLIFGTSDASPFAASQRTVQSLVGGLGATTTTLASALNNASNVVTTPVVQPWFGQQYLVLYRNASYLPVMYSIIGAPNTDFIPVSLGQTSTPVPILATPSAPSGVTAVTNTVLLGVNVGFSAANQTLITTLTKGTAFYSTTPGNNTYPFDYTGYSAPGVRGIASGTSIILDNE